jgi:hypothetical protein
LIHLNMALIAHYQASKITQPCERTLHFPTLSVSSQLSTILLLVLRSIASMWHNHINFQVLKTLSKRITVIAFIGDKPFGALFRSASTSTRNVDCIKSLFGQLYFRRGCRGKDASQRNTLAVDHHHPLRSFAFFGFSDASAPFFAGAKLPSIKASSQSSSPSASSMDKNLRHTSSHTPWSSHRRRRLQQVAGLGYRSGKSCHRAPVRRTHSMPSKTFRLSMAGRPPFGLALGSGSSGFNSFHCSSFMNRVYLAIGSPPIA